MGVAVTGIGECVRALEAVGARVQAATPVAVLAAAALVEGRARAGLSRASHRRGTPTPSAPGSPPALVTGVLRSSFAVTGPVGDAGSWTSVLGPTAPYARVQELGGVTGRGHAVVLPARPYLRPAAEAVRRDPALIGVFARMWGAAVTG